MPSSLRSLAAAWLVALAACSETPVDPVAAPPSRLVIVDPGTVRDGDVVVLRAQALRPDNSIVPDVPFTWTSTDPTVATVTPSGVLTALREGQTELVVASGALQQRRALQVTLHPAVAIDLGTTALQVPLGTRGGLTPVVRGVDGRILLGRSVTLESSNPNVLRVTAATELVPVVPGVVTVTARHGTLSASVQVTVPTPAVTTDYDVRTFGGTALPAVIHEALIRDNGFERVSEISRLESGTMLIDGATYAVSLTVVHYERTEILGNIGMRQLSRQVVSDRGALVFDWFDGTAQLQSTDVGGLTHALDSDASGPRLRFRQGGTLDTWSLGLVLR